MPSQNWQQHTSELHARLAGLTFSDGAGERIDTDAGYAQWCVRTVELRQNRGTVYLIGNGASASMASHFAADLAKNAQLNTQVFSDLSLITAISNDMGYEHVFAEPLRRRGHQRDMLVAISSSGKSPNILAAVDVAKEIGMTIVTLTGMGGDNPLRSRGSLNLYVAAESYSLAESCHAAALHWWIDQILVSSANGAI
jgi:D-sedoheptulose 7-phosphate isomerase